MKRIRSLAPATFIVLAFVGYAFLVSAAAPSGGYTPGATLDPDCAPGDTDCIVQSSGGATPTNGLSTLTGGIGLGGTLTEDTVIDQDGFNLSTLYEGGITVGPYTLPTTTGLQHGTYTYFQTNELTQLAGFSSSIDLSEFSPGLAQNSFIGLTTTGEEEVWASPAMVKGADGALMSVILGKDGPVLYSTDGNGNESKIEMGEDNISLFVSNSMNITAEGGFDISDGVSFSPIASFASPADLSVVLALNSTTAGFLMPRMTEAERDAISSPATGLQIYNTDDDEFNYYNGSSWVALGGGGGSSQWSDIAAGSSFQFAGSGLNDVTLVDADGFTDTFIMMIIGNVGDTSVSYTNKSGNFAAGDTVVGNTSGATATLRSITDINSVNIIFLYNVTGTFMNGETITNQTNSETLDLTSEPAVTSNDSFLWYHSNPDTSGVLEMTGSNQVLFNNFTVSFASTTGHTVYDLWGLTIQQSGIAYNNGLVGIGTTTPAADLNVLGNILFYGEISGTENLSFVMDATGDIFQDSAALQLGYSDSATGEFSGFTAYQGGSRMSAGLGSILELGTDYLNLSFPDTGMNEAFAIGNTGFNLLAGTNWITGEENKFFFDTATPAIRLGSVDDDNWDSSNRGDRSIAIGFAIPGFSVPAPMADGLGSIALGSGSTASGIGSFASGLYALASGPTSIALGNNVTAGGQYAVALGSNTNAGGDRSFAVGPDTTAPSFSEAVFGSGSTTYVPVSSTSFDLADRIFTVGNGEFGVSQSDAFTILKSGQIGIGIDNFEVSADASALLTLGSTTQGFLLPRMTESERDAISSPATGLFIYNTDTNAFNYYDSAAWSPFGSTLIGSTSSLSTETWLGDGAGDNASNIGGTVFIGRNAGIDSIASGTIFIGSSAGYLSNAPSSIFIGSNSGGEVDLSSGSIFIGASAGNGATNASRSIFIGSGTGTFAGNATNSIFIGEGTGNQAGNATNSIFIGVGSGSGNVDALDNTQNPDDYSILIGNSTSTGSFSNSIALGHKVTNTATNQFMIGSSTRPIDSTIINGTGGTECTITTGTGMACTSDIRLKTNIQDLSSSTLEDLLNVRTVTYNWKSSPNGDNMIGFLAQDLEQYFPELVSTNERGQKSVYYAQMTPVLVEAIRELDLKISDFQDVSEGSTFGDMLRGWFADATNGIQKLFVGEVQTDKLCVGERCITEDQFNQLLDSVTNPGFYSSDDQAPAFTDPVPEIPVEAPATETIDEPQAPVADPVTEPAPEPEPIPEPEAPVVESTPTE